MNRLTMLGVVAAAGLSVATAVTIHFLLLLAEAAGVLLEIIARTLEVYP